MITYDARSWFQVLTGVHQSRVIRRVAVLVVPIGVYAATVTLATRRGWIPALPLNPTLVPVVSVLLSLLLAFRTNTAYDRWWEGRKLWERLVNQSRSLAVFLAAVLEPEDWENRRLFAADIAAFAEALREHLRVGGAPADLGDLPPAVLEELREKKHLPLALCTRITARVHALFKAGAVSGYELRNLKDQIGAFMEILGACERIQGTPIPFSYNAYVKHLVFWYCAALPFGLQETSGLLAVPVSMLAFAAMVGLEMLAGDIEDPFGSDENDLPIQRIASGIRGDVYEVLLDAPPPEAAASGGLGG